MMFWKLTASNDQLTLVKYTITCIHFPFRRLIVALERQIHVFSFPTPTRRLLTLETRDNPRGLIEIATLATAHKQLLAFPGHKLGSVQLVDLGCIEASTSSAPTTLPAHQVTRQTFLNVVS